MVAMSLCRPFCYCWAVTLQEKRRKKATYMRAYAAANADKINAQRRARRTPEMLDRERRWRTQNRAKVLTYKKAERERRPADYKRWKQAWAARNSGKLHARAKADYAANKEAIAERVKKRDKARQKATAARWKAAHPDKVREASARSQSRRRAELAHAENEPINHRAIYERDNRRCGICRKYVAWARFSLDHIVPLSRGGAHIPSNVQTAHRRCNSRKGNRGAVQPRLRL
jgi:5-methylcytosine-specific restriction endonuclease McrA